MGGQHTWLFAAIFCASVCAEPPVTNTGKSLVSRRLLNRVADIIANNGDGRGVGDDGTQGLEGPAIVDQELLDRIARIIGQNDGQLSWSHKAHSKSADQSAQPSRTLSLPNNANEIPQEYGIPPTEVPETAKELAGPQFELSPPEPVPRIASFDWRDEDEAGYSRSSKITQDSYADNRNLQQGNDQVQLGDPQSAVRIASFNIDGEQAPAPFTPAQKRGGYFSNY